MPATGSPRRPESGIPAAVRDSGNPGSGGEGVRGRGGSGCGARARLGHQVTGIDAGNGITQETGPESGSMPAPRRPDRGGFPCTQGGSVSIKKALVLLLPSSMSY